MTTITTSPRTLPQRSTAALLCMILLVMPLMPLLTGCQAVPHDRNMDDVASITSARYGPGMSVDHGVWKLTELNFIMFWPALAGGLILLPFEALTAPFGYTWTNVY